MKLEEESQLISHDLEDTAAKPSEATIELTKSLIDCIEKYVNGTYTHTLMPVMICMYIFTYRVSYTSNAICGT